MTDKEKYTCLLKAGVYHTSWYPLFEAADFANEAWCREGVRTADCYSHIVHCAKLAWIDFLRRWGGRKYRIKWVGLPDLQPEGWRTNPYEPTYDPWPEVEARMMEEEIYERLTKDERKILRWQKEGVEGKVIAQRLGISIGTYNYRKRKMAEKIERLFPELCRDKE